MHEFEQTPGDSEGHGNLTSHSPQDHKQLDTTQRLNKQHTSTSDEFPQHLLIWECLNVSFIFE